MTTYAQAVKDVGELIEVSEFLSVVTSGFCYPVKGGRMNSDIIIQPGQPSRIPADATHLVWISW